MKSAIVVTMILSAVVGLNGLSTPANAPAAVLLPCVALSGADSQIGEEGYLRITNLNDWVKLWRKHKGNKSEREYDFHYDPLGLPIVDFERFMVIALFERGWDGFRADSISETPAEITFCFRAHGHSTGFVRPFPNNPEDCVDEDDDPEPLQKTYGFFFVPKSNKAIVVEKKVREFKPHKIFTVPAIE